MTARSTFRSRRSTISEDGFLGRLIDPIDRLAETIFSILILLTFTLAFRIIKLSGLEMALDPSVNTRELFTAALGAILAWGVIDGMLYALLGLFERSESHRLLIKIQSEADESDAVQAIADDLDHILEPITGDTERLALYQNILATLKTSQPRPLGFQREDFTGALGHVIVALLVVTPSLVPLLVFQQDYELALRVSNIISFIMLFIAGYQWGKYTGTNPWKIGLLLMSLAVVLVLIAIPLGG